MIPILYTADETRFITNGLGRLSDCTRAVVTEERNGLYELEFDVPITGVHYDEIELGRIVACTHDDKHDIQPFVIYSRTVPDLNGIVTFNAYHISYRLNKVAVMPFSATSVVTALQGIKNNSVNANPFNFWTDKATVANFDSGVPRMARAMLGGEENSILDVFGGGEYEFDRFDVKLHAHRGRDSDVEIRYSKNLTDLNENIDDSSSYNAVVPYWADSEGNVVTLPEQVLIYSGIEPQIAYLTDHNLIIIRTETNEPIEVAYTEVSAVPLDMSDAFQEMPSESQLRSAARSRFETSGAWLPSENITVDFIQLWQTEEFADYSALQRVSLCDTVSIYYPQAGVSQVKQKVVRVVYNVLLDRYDEIELGSVSTSLGQAIKSDILQNVPTNSMMESAIQYATDMIRGGLGGYVVMTPGPNGYPQEILIMDTPDIDTAVNVWRFNQGGLGHSHSGYQGPYDDIALTQDGKINASMITTGILNADYIRAGTLASEDGLNSWDLAGGNLIAQKGTIGGFEITSSSLEYSQGSSTMRIRGNSIEFIYEDADDNLYYYALTPTIDGLRLRLKPASGSYVDCPQIRPYIYLGNPDGNKYPEATINANNAIRLGSFSSNVNGTNPLTIFIDEPAHIGGSTQTISQKVLIRNGAYIIGGLTVSGTKSRSAKTDNYSDRLLYCYETPTPLFGDIGEAIIDEDGFGYVDLDDIFSETIAEKVEYQVFLQKEGEGDCWIAEKNPRYFVIQGTPGLKVAWELKAKQRDYELTRLEQSGSYLDEYDDINDVSDLMSNYITEQEDLLYGNY